MTRHVDRPDPAEGTDWADRYPADPDLMASPEGDRKGLAELRAVARRRRERLGRR